MRKNDIAIKLINTTGELVESIRLQEEANRGIAERYLLAVKELVDKAESHYGLNNYEINIEFREATR